MSTYLAHFGHWMQPERRQDKGPMPKPRWMPLPELLYAQVVKSYRRRRIVGVTHRVVFGTQLAIEQVLARWGWTINTAFIERKRSQGDHRGANLARVGRKADRAHIAVGASGGAAQRITSSAWKRSVG